MTYTEGEHVKNTLETHGEGDILAYCGGNIPAYIGGNHGIQEEDTERYQVTEGFEGREGCLCTWQHTTTTTPHGGQDCS